MVCFVLLCSVLVWLDLTLGFSARWVCIVGCGCEKIRGVGG